MATDGIGQMPPMGRYDNHKTMIKKAEELKLRILNPGIVESEDDFEELDDEEKEDEVPEEDEVPMEDEE